MFKVQSIKDALIYTQVNDKLIITSLEKYLDRKDNHRILTDDDLYCTSDLAFQGHERAMPIKDIPLDELRECYYEENAHHRSNHHILMIKRYLNYLINHLRH